MFLQSFSLKLMVIVFKTLDYAQNDIDCQEAPALAEP